MQRTWIIPKPSPSWLVEKLSCTKLFPQAQKVGDRCPRGWASQVALVVKNPPANERDMGSIPRSRRSPGGRHGNPLQYSCPENPMDRGAWRHIAHWVAKSWTCLKQLSMHACPRGYRKNAFFPNYLSSEFQTCKIKPILATMYHYWLLSDHNNCCYSVAKLHTKVPCPSLSPGVCSHSCPLSQWCYLTISSSMIPFSSSSQSFPASGSFPMSWLFTSGGQSIRASASASDLPMNIPGWFPLGLTGFISIPAITK